MLLRVHQSNFRVVGFSELPRLAELAEIARAHELPLVDDLGSGALVPVGDEPTPADEPPRGRRPRHVLAATSCSVGRRPGSSSGGASSSSGSGGIHSSARCAPTS